MKVARGRSWQPEIGMEHASRGRRSGNKGVGARWRGRFRIFSARHCSRTKVSHAENSGMTMLFFSLEVAPMSEGDSFTGSPAANAHSGSIRPDAGATPNPLIPRAAAPAAACVAGRSRGQRSLRQHPPGCGRNSQPLNSSCRRGSGSTRG